MDRGTRPVLRGIARETVRLLTPQVRDVARDFHDLATDTRELGLPATFIVSIG